MDLINTILECLTGDPITTPNSTPQLLSKPLSSTLNLNLIQTTTEKEKDQAAIILNQIFTSEKSLQNLQHQLQQQIRTTSWTSTLSKHLLDGLISALNSSKAMGAPLKEAYDKVSEIAAEFVREHPVFTSVMVTVVAIGILVILVPWAVEALGFAELGPVEGSFAAWWQSTFPDAEAGSFFSYLQRLGMKWGKK